MIISRKGLHLQRPQLGQTFVTQLRVLLLRRVSSFSWEDLRAIMIISTSKDTTRKQNVAELLPLYSIMIL